MSVLAVAELRTSGEPPAASSRTAENATYAHREHWSPRGTWDRDRIIAALRDWCAYTGSPPRSYEWAPGSAAARGMATARVDLWKQRYPRWPSTSTVCSHFGRWSKALRAAGLQPHRQIAAREGRAARVHAAQRMARDGVAIKHIAEVLEVSPRTARAYLTAGQCADCRTPVITASRCPTCAARHSAKPRFTRAETLHAIRAWTQETGRSPRIEEWSPTSDPRRKWAREYPRWPSGMTVRTHFGSWTAALKAACQSANRLAWDRPSIIGVLKRLAIEIGRPPITDDLNRTDMPAPGTVRHHFGSFAAALAAAGYEPRRRRWQREDILQALASFEDAHTRLPTERDWNRATAEHPHASTVRQHFGSWRELIDAHRTRPARPRVRRYLAAVVGMLVWMSAAGGLPAARAAGQSVVELPVSFHVVNSNTSQDPCVSDGGSYTIRGHLTGPEPALRGSPAPPITMYLYGYEGGEWNWNLKGVPGYDYAAEMAKLGHVSLTLDELGYGTSGHPRDGNLTCQGALADIAHQIIGDLRSGSYSLNGGPGIPFNTVVLAGHDVGGQVAEIEAYSYDDINGLILVTWADQGFTSWIVQRSAVAAGDWCTTSPLQTSPGGLTGYVHFVSDQEFRSLLFYRAAPRVVAATDALRNANPCGIMRSVPIAAQFDSAKTQSVTVPVLDIYGADDTLVWSRSGEAQQQDNFGSKDKTTVFIPNSGHFPMFERSAPQFRGAISAWLNSRF